MAFLRSQAAIDIKVKRMVHNFNRLDPTYLREWRKDYDTARADYLKGDINRIDFSECMQALGFRSDALKAEILDAERDKNNPSYVAPKQDRFYRYEA